MAIKQFMVMTAPELNISWSTTNEDNIVDSFIDQTSDHWNRKRLEAKLLVEKIDELIPRSSWSSSDCISWKFEDGKIDNDASVEIDDNLVSYFCFRSDLTEPNHRFLKSMLNICQEFDLFIYTLTGKNEKPEYPRIVPLIEESSAFNFLKDPFGFFSSLNNEPKHVI